MIKKITHTPLIVKDQEEALTFFTEKIGLEKRDDSPMGKNQRWLTVGCKKQPDIEIILQAVDWGMDNATPQELTAQIGKQGFVFSSDDIEGDYNSLKEKGVKVLAKPKKESWGYQFSFEDLYGNIHLLVQ
ncbi:MAG: VOC family protein [Bacteroidota bacterium]